MTETIAPIYQDDEFIVFYRPGQLGEIFITVARYDKTYRAFPKPYSSDIPNAGWAYYWKDGEFWHSTSVIPGLSENACQELDCKTPITHGSSELILGSVFDSEDKQIIYQGLCPRCAFLGGFCLECGIYCLDIYDNGFVDYTGHCSNCETHMLDSINDIRGDYDY